MFKYKFKVVEIYPSGLKVENMLEGKRSDVKKDIETFKTNCKFWETVNKRTMIVVK